MSDYLGLIMDEKLSWQQYVCSVKQKISSILMALRQVAFLTEKSKIMLYHCLIESRYATVTLYGVIATPI